MGSSSSKVAKRTLKGQQVLGRAATAPQRPATAEVEQQQLDQGFTDMSDKDPQMGALLSNLHGSISSRHMDMGKVKAEKHVIRQSKEERDAGRLRLGGLRALLAEQTASTAGTDPETIKDLASRYGVDTEALQKTLRYTRLVALESDGASH